MFGKRQAPRASHRHRSLTALYSPCFRPLHIPRHPFLGIITIPISLYRCGDGDDRFSGVFVLTELRMENVSQKW